MMTTSTRDSRPSGAAKRLSPLAWAPLLVLALGAATWLGVNHFRDVSAADTETSRQKAEIEECKKRLAAFYSAWQRYVADHKGHAPASYADLVPKYITKPETLICPTAERWRASGHALQSGSIKVGDRSYPVTYGFRVFTASFPVQLRKTGEQTVIVACDAHEEGMYRAVFHRAPPVSAFEESQRAALPDTVANSKVIVLRKNGQVDQVLGD